MKAVKPSVSSCSSRSRSRCSVRCSRLLADAEHHGGRALQAAQVGGLHHGEPLVGRALERRDAPADLVVEDLGAAAGDGVEPGRHQPVDGLVERRARSSARCARISSGESAWRLIDRPLRLHPAEQVLVPLDAEVRVEAALEQDLDPAERAPSRRSCAASSSRVEDVGLLVAARPVERAEVARGGAHVRVVHVARDDVGDHALRVERAAPRVGGEPQLEQRRLLVEQLRLVRRRAARPPRPSASAVSSETCRRAFASAPRRPRSGRPWAAGSPSPRRARGTPPAPAARTGRGRSGSAA